MEKTKVDKNTSGALTNNRTKNIVGCAFCIALGVTVPMIFHLFGAGMTFTPMHLPILLCGFCFGPFYGMICGLVTPFISSITTGMPVLYPTCITMTAELAAYGFVSGYLYRNKHLNIYVALILSMLVGRAIAGIVSAVLLGASGQPYSLSTFVSVHFITSIPGIIIQIIVVPLLVLMLIKARVISKAD